MSMCCVVLQIFLRLQGACGSCPSSTVTMKMGVERVLREKFGQLGKVGPCMKTNRLLYVYMERSRTRSLQLRPLMHCPADGMQHIRAECSDGLTVSCVRVRVYLCMQVEAINDMAELSEGDADALRTLVEGKVNEIMPAIRGLGGLCVCRCVCVCVCVCGESWLGVMFCLPLGHGACLHASLRALRRPRQLL
jgi:hypothetical protein